MNDLQTRKLNAAVAGQSVMDEPLHIPIWTGQAAVALKRTALNLSILKIGKIDDKINDTTGNADSKSVAKEKAAKSSWVMGQALVAFAEDTNDDVLREEIDFPWTQLRYGKDGNLVDRWQLIRDRANTNSVALIAGGYGVTALLITGLQTDIDAFKNWKGKPKAARADTKAQNALLVDEFATLDSLKSSLLTRMVQFAVSSPDFYNAVLNAFEIDDIGVRHNAIRLVYVDSATGIRLSGVKAKLVEKEIEKVSSKVGVTTFTQQEATQGNYTVESSLKGYPTVVNSNIGAQDGKLAKIVVVMTKP